MEIISEWHQHRSESVALICQGEGVEFVEHVWSTGDGRKQPVYVLFIDTLEEGGKDPQETSGIGTEFLEHRRDEGEFARGCETPGVLCAKYLCLLSPPFLGKSVGTPLVVLGNGSE